MSVNDIQATNLLLENFQGDLKKSLSRTLVLELSRDHLMQIGGGHIDRGLRIVAASAQAVYDHDLLSSRRTGSSCFQNTGENNTNILLLRPDNKDANAFVLYDALFNLLDRKIHHEYNKELTKSVVKAAISVGFKGIIGGAVVEALDGLTGSYFGALQEKAITYASEIGGQALEWLTDSIFGEISGVILEDHLEEWTEGASDLGIHLLDEYLSTGTDFHLEEATIRSIQKIYEEFNPESTNYAKLFDFLVQVTMVLTQNGHKAIVVENPHLLDQGSFSILTKLLSITRDLTAQHGCFIKLTIIFLYLDERFQPQGEVWQVRVADPEIEANLVTWDGSRRLRNFLMRYGMLETPVSDISRMVVRSDLFVGRREELKRLNEHGQEVFQNAGRSSLARVDVILGDPGVGKTALYYRYIRDNFFSVADDRQEIEQNTIIRLKVINEPGLASANSGLSTLESAIVQEIQRLENYAKIVYQYRNKMSNVLAWMADTGASWGLHFLDIENLLNISKAVRNRITESRHRTTRDANVRNLKERGGIEKRADYYEAVLDSIRLLQILALRIRGKIKATESVKFLVSKKMPETRKREAFQNILERGGGREPVLLFIDDLQWIDEETSAFLIQYLLPLDLDLHLICTCRAKADLVESYNRAYSAITEGDSRFKLALFENFQLFSANSDKRTCYHLSDSEKAVRGLNNVYFNTDPAFLDFNQTLYVDSEGKSLDTTYLNKLQVNRIVLAGMDQQTVVELVENALLPPVGQESGSMDEGSHADKSAELGRAIFAFLGDTEAGALEGDAPPTVNTHMAVETLNMLSDERLYQEEGDGLKPIISFTSENPHFSTEVHLDQVANQLFRRLKEKYRAAFRETQGSFNLASFAVMEERLHLIQADLGLSAYYGILISAFVGIPFQKRILAEVLLALSSSQDPWLQPVRAAFKDLSGLQENDYETLENIYEFMRRLARDNRRYKHALLEDFLTVKVDREISRVWGDDIAHAKRAKEVFHNLVYEVIESIYVLECMDEFSKNYESSYIREQFRDYWQIREEAVKELELGEITEEEFRERGFSDDDPENADKWSDDDPTMIFWWRNFWGRSYVPPPVIYRRDDQGFLIRYFRNSWTKEEEREELERLMYAHISSALDIPGNIQRMIGLVRCMTNAAKPSKSIPLMEETVSNLKERISKSTSKLEWLYDPDRTDCFADLLMSRTLVLPDSDLDREQRYFHELIMERYAAYPAAFKDISIQSRIWMVSSEVEPSETAASLWEILRDSEGYDPSEEFSVKVHLHSACALFWSLVVYENNKEAGLSLLEGKILPVLFDNMYRFPDRQYYLEKIDKYLTILHNLSNHSSLWLVKWEQQLANGFQKGILYNEEEYIFELTRLVKSEGLTKKRREKLENKISSFYEKNLQELSKKLMELESYTEEARAILRRYTEIISYTDGMISSQATVKYQDLLFNIAESFCYHGFNENFDDIFDSLHDLIQHACIALDIDGVSHFPEITQKIIQLHQRLLVMTTKAFAVNPQRWFDHHLKAVEHFARVLMHSEIEKSESLFVEGRRLRLQRLYETSDVADLLHPWPTCYSSMDDFNGLPSDFGYHTEAEFEQLYTVTTLQDFYRNQSRYVDLERLLREDLFLSLKFAGYDKWYIRNDLAKLYLEQDQYDQFRAILAERQAESLARFHENKTEQWGNYAADLNEIAEQFKSVDREMTLTLQQEELSIYQEQYQESPEDIQSSLEECLDRLIKTCKKLGRKDLLAQYRSERKNLEQFS